MLVQFNRLTPNDPYMGRTAPLTSKRCILYIYSTNVGTECFKHALYSPFFFSSKCSLFHNANLFGSCIIHILYTGCAEIKKKNSGTKRLTVLMHGSTHIRRKKLWGTCCHLDVYALHFQSLYIAVTWVRIFSDTRDVVWCCSH